jgi:hypothetical protein
VVGAIAHNVIRWILILEWMQKVVTTQLLLKIIKWNSAIAPASPKAPNFGALPPA